MLLLANDYEMHSFEKQKIYKSNKLYFLLCLDDEARKESVFYNDFKKELTKLPRDIKKSLASKDISEISNTIRERCKKIFCYDVFSKIQRKRTYHNKDWNAYSYLSDSCPSYCPYCNISQTTFIENKKNEDQTTYKIRPALDHFYSKDSYPFLAISLNNLVPACYICNTSLKLTKNFKITRHLNPYGSSFEGIATFILTSKIDDIETTINSIYNGEVDVNSISIGLLSNDSRVKENESTFAILSRYNKHKNDLNLFLKNLPRLKSDTLKRLKIDFCMNNDKEVLEMFLQYDTNKSNNCNTQYSVIKRDLINYYLSEELKLKV